MWAAIAAVAGAVVAFLKYLTGRFVKTVYFDHFSPTTKKRRKEEKDFRESNKSGDPGGMI